MLKSSLKIEGKVLIAEDSDPLRTLLVNICARTGLITFEAAHGRAAVKLLETESVDLFLMDMHMPFLSGLDLLEVLNRKAPQDVPATVLITGETRPEEKVKAATLGAWDFIQKPFSYPIIEHCLWRNSRLLQLETALASDFGAAEEGGVQLEGAASTMHDDVSQFAQRIQKPAGGGGTHEHGLVALAIRLRRASDRLGRKIYAEETNDEIQSKIQHILTEVPTTDVGPTAIEHFFIATDECLFVISHAPASTTTALKKSLHQAFATEFDEFAMAVTTEEFVGANGPARLIRSLRQNLAYAIASGSLPT